MVGSGSSRGPRAAELSGTAGKNSWAMAAWNRHFKITTTINRFSMIGSAALFTVACSGSIVEHPIEGQPDSGSGDAQDANTPDVGVTSSSLVSSAPFADSATSTIADASLLPFEADTPFTEDANTPPPDAAVCTLSDAVAARWIASDSDRDSYNRDIYFVRADGSQLVRVTADPSTEKDPAFSNDGASLAFASDRSGVMQIYTMNLTTHEEQQLTSLSAGADEPSWSPDDSQIVFHSGASIYIMNFDGSNPKIIATGPDAVYNMYKYPSVTPDGLHVLCDRGNEIDTMSLDGTGFRYVIGNTTQTIETPALSPDGVTIAFATASTIAEQIAVAPYGDTTEAWVAQTVTPGASGSTRRPAWGPDNVFAMEHAAPASTPTPQCHSLARG